MELHLEELVSMALDEDYWTSTLQPSTKHDSLVVDPFVKSAAPFLEHPSWGRQNEAWSRLAVGNRLFSWIEQHRNLSLRLVSMRVRILWRFLTVLSLYALALKRVPRIRMSSTSFSVSESLPFPIFWFLPDTFTLVLERIAMSGMARSGVMAWVKWMKMFKTFAPTATSHLQFRCCLHQLQSNMDVKRHIHYRCFHCLVTDISWIILWFGFLEIWIV